MPLPSGRSRRLLVVAGASFAIFACGKDVDLGGTTPDGGGPSGGACDPCLSAQECQANASCAQIGSHTFCASSCDEAMCSASEACRSVITSTGASVRACVPEDGACAPAPGPTGVDGGTCGALNGPSVASTCSSCSRFSNSCQPNGCYGGWWCNTTTRRCQRPPMSCR